MATRHSKPVDPDVTIPAVAYLRCSTDQQVDASIPAQREAIIRWAAENGYSICRWYSDEGVSGWKSDQRDGFKQLIADLDRRDFRAVLCWDQNRFSRFEPLEANHYWYLLDRAGVHLATVNQGRIDWHSIAGWLTASIRQHADAEHRHKLAADVRRGLRALAEQGRWHTRIPLGYIIGPNGKLAPGDPEQIALVRRLFTMAAAGQSLRAIAIQLNQEGIASPRGYGWAGGVVGQILRNPTYSGRFAIGGADIPDNHPALIDPETFQMVQAALADRRGQTTPIVNGGDYILSGLIRCGRCGAAMGGHRNRNGAIFYRCAGHEQKGRCGPNTVHQAPLLELLLENMERQLRDPETAEQLRERIKAKLRERERTRQQPAPERIRRHLAALEAKLAKAKQRLVEVDRDLLPVVQDQLRTLMAEREQLAAALEAASVAPAAVLADHGRLIDLALKACQTLRQTLAAADPVRVRQLLRERVQRVDVWAERNGRGYVFRRGVAFVRIGGENGKRSLVSYGTP